MTDAVQTLRERYERTPYPGGSYRFTHPDRLSVMGQLSGLTPPPVEGARILELGCGNGFNTVAMAAWLPSASVVGVDLSAAILERGRAMAAAIGLDNVTLLEGSFDALPDDLGCFDYIIAHGVFSWIPQALQQTLLDVAGAHLAPNGLIHVSYNVLPGWHLQGYVRELMRFGMVGDSSQAQVEAAQATLSSVAAELADGDGVQATILQTAVREMTGQSPGYLWHDYLADENHPIYFRDFVRLAAQSGLRWVGEARPGEHRCFGLSRGLNIQLEAVASRVEREQLLDFIRARRFRRSVLAHQGDTVATPGAHEALSRLWFVIRSVPSEPHAPIMAGIHVTFVTRDELDIEVDNPWVKSALFHLFGEHPRPVCWGELTEAVGRIVGRPAPPQLAETLLHLFELEAIDLLPRPIPVLTRAPRCPIAAPVVRYQAEHWRNGVVNAFHERGELGAIERQLLLAADGTRDADGLTEALLEAVKSGQITAHLGEDEVRDLTAIRAALADMVPTGIEELVRLALLECPQGN